MNQFSVSRNDTVDAVKGAKQADRLLEMLDVATVNITRHVCRINEAIQRLAGPGAPVAIATCPASASPGGSLGRIGDKLAELRIEADRLEHIADRLEAIA